MNPKYFQGNPYKRPTSPYYYVFFDDASGRHRNISAKTKDLRVAQCFLAKKLEEVARLKNGIVDRFARTREKPIDGLVVEFRQHVEGQGAVPKYSKEITRQIRQYIEFAGVARITDVTVAGADNFLDDLRKKKSAKTRDHHAAALRSFGKWLEAAGLWNENPLRGVKGKTANRDRHRKFRRTGFSFEEVERLVDAAMTRFLAEQRKGGQPTHGKHENGDAVRDRQVLYWLAATTGFRAKEIAAIRWEDCMLNGDRLAIRLAGQFTKNGSDALQALQPFVAEMLKDMRRRRSVAQVATGKGPAAEGDFVLKVPCKIAELVRKDAAQAGLTPLRSPGIRRVDFHCLRYSCARILIQMRLHPKIVQGFMRHGDIRLTMDLYGQLGEDDVYHEVAGKLPVPRGYRVQSEVQSTPVPHGSSAVTTCRDDTTEKGVAGRDVCHG